MARYNRIASFALPVPAKAKGHISNKETNNSFFMVLPFSGDSIWALVYIRIFTSHQFPLFPLILSNWRSLANGLSNILLFRAVLVLPATFLPLLCPPLQYPLRLLPYPLRCTEMPTAGGFPARPHRSRCTSVIKAGCNPWITHCQAIFYTARYYGHFFQSSFRLFLHFIK